MNRCVVCGATKMVPKKCHTICQTVSKPIYLLQFFLSKMTAQLRNDFFVCVDNFAIEKKRDHKQRTPGEGLTHKYNPHILADLAKICLIF